MVPICREGPQTESEENESSRDTPRRNEECGSRVAGGKTKDHPPS